MDAVMHAITARLRERGIAAPADLAVTVEGNIVRAAFTVRGEHWQSAYRTDAGSSERSGIEGVAWMIEQKVKHG